MALHDSRLHLVCALLDESAAGLLDIWRDPPPRVPKHLPELLARLAAAHECLQQLICDLGRFDPPETELESAERIDDISQLYCKFAVAVLECAATGLGASAWISASDLYRRCEQLVASIIPPARDRSDDVGPDEDLRLERSLGLSTEELSAGDGLTFASRVAAAWAKHPELDERLRAGIPHLLDPETPLRDKVRMHLTQLLGSDRPLVAHQAAVAARDVVLQALSSDEDATVQAIGEEVAGGPVMYATHQCLIAATQAFNQATGLRDQMRPALQMYAPVMEGDVRRAACLALRLLGRQVAFSTTLTPLAEQLSATSSEPMCALLASCIRPTWRNAIAHEQVWWDSARQCPMLAGEPVEAAAIADEALRAHEICRGLETGIAVALNQAGNPHERGQPTRTETASSIRILIMLGTNGIPASRLDREGSIIRPLIAPLTIHTMDYLHSAILQSTAKEPEEMNWEILQTADRPPYRISHEAVTTVLGIREGSNGGQHVTELELPVSALPMILSGLIAHDPSSSSIVPAIIALAAANIIGERKRLASSLAFGDTYARASFLQTLKRTARAVDAAGSLAQTSAGQELRAFARLVVRTYAKLSTRPSAEAADMRAIEIALQSSVPAYLPWLEDSSALAFP
jgi:hypothetical protein